MEAPNGDSKGEDYLLAVSNLPLFTDGYSSSSRRDDHSSSRRRDDYRSSRHGDERYDSSRYRDRDRDRDREKRPRDPEESSHHRRESGRDYNSSNRGEYSSNRGEYGSSSRGGYGSSRSHGDDYQSSRDREPRFDSRRGGSGRYDGPKGGGHGGRDRKRSPSPKRQRGSSPDLTGVVPIDERKRRLTMWDLKPAGYENVTAEQAKMSGLSVLKSLINFLGLFPLPGAPRNPQQFSEASLKAIAEGKAPPSGPAGSSLAPLEVPKLWALDASNSRQGRRLVVSKLPPSSTEAEIHNFFNDVIRRLNIYKESGGEPVKDVKKATSGGIAMVEFSESTYATTALAIEDDIEYSGVQLELRRPHDYIIQPPPKDLTLSSDTVSTEVPDSTEKLVIKGLPAHLTSEQGLELVEAFGAVQGWILISEPDSSESKVPILSVYTNDEGVAFTQFKDATITPIALNSLNGMQLNEEHTLSVSFACVGYSQIAIATDCSGGAMGMVTSLAGERGDTPRSRVLILLNMVTGDDLMDADEYDDILQDVKEECDRHGKVLDLQIPRPLGRSGEGPGVGKVFVRFETEEGCAAALKGLAGRKFSERTIVASYYPEVSFNSS